MRKTVELGLVIPLICELFTEWRINWKDDIIASIRTLEASAEATNVRCATSACLSGSMIASNVTCKSADVVDEIDYECSQGRKQ
jgi:hypothetical protein